MKKILFYFLIFSSFTVLYSCNIFSRSFSKGNFDTKENDFDFNVKNEKGEIVNLNDILTNGKTTYLDIWSTTCKPCLAEIPFADTLHQNLKNTDIQFVNLAIDSKTDEWKKMIREKNITGINLIDTDNLVKEHIELEGVPYYILTNGDGKTLGNDITIPSEGILTEFILFNSMTTGDTANKSFKKFFKNDISEEYKKWKAIQLGADQFEMKIINKKR